LQVSVPILNGAASSLISTLALALGNSYVFISFYKTMILVFVLGVLHSIVFLPVLLSFVGPRRTSKPRVYVGQHTDTSNNHPNNHHVRRNHSHLDIDDGNDLALRPLNHDAALESAPTSTTATSLSSAQRQDIPIDDVTSSTRTSTNVPSSIDARVGFDSDEDHSSIGDDYDDEYSARRRYCLNVVSELTDTDDQEFGDCVSEATGGDDQNDQPVPITGFVGTDIAIKERPVSGEHSQYLVTPDDRNTMLANRSQGIKRSNDDEDQGFPSPGGAATRRRVSFDTIKETSMDDD